jgi:hypothetical protein
MSISAKTAVWAALLIEVAAFIRCLVEYIRLTFFASTASALMNSAQPFLLGTLAALGYAAASITLYRKGKFILSSSLAVLLVFVLLALKFAYQ